MYNDVKKAFVSKISSGVLYTIGILIVAILIFSAGVMVGSHKANFGRAWSEHYMDNFGMMPTRNNFNIGENYFPNAHGADGKIIKIELPNIIVQDEDDIEKVIAVTANTKIQKGRVDVASSDLKIDDFVVIIGTPNDQGVIEAKFIRVMPNGDSL